MHARLAQLKRLVLQHEGFVIIVLLMLFLRIPNLFEPYWYGDEGIYLAVGQAMDRGAILYSQIVDHKTPLIYLIAAFVKTQFWLRVWLIASSVISVGLFYRICMQLIKSRKLQLMATGLFTLLTTLPWLEGNIANGELLLMPMVLSGVWLFFHVSPKLLTKPNTQGTEYGKMARVYPLLIGFLFGMATLLKVPAMLDLVAVGAFLLLMVLPVQNTRLRFIGVVRFGLWIIAGFLGTLTASVLFFAVYGSVADYIQFGLLYNLFYAGVWQPTTLPSWLVPVSSLGGRLVLFGGLVIAAAVAVHRKLISMRVGFVVIWFLLALFAAILSLRPYPHYLIQALPPAVLLLGLYFDEVSRLMQGGIAGLVLMLVMIIHYLGFGFYETWPYYRNFSEYLIGQMDETEYRSSFDWMVPSVYEAATWLRMRTAPDEPIFIWGNVPTLYALADRSPVGPYTVAFHIESFEAHDETMIYLRQEEPDYVLVQEGMPEWQTFNSWLRARYDKVREFGGLSVYRALPD